MGQKEHIEEIIKKSEEQKKRSERIQTSYEKYILYGENQEFDVLITELDAYCISWIRKQLWKTGCYSDENEHTVMQESRLAAWNILEENRRTKILRNNFANYMFGVYKHKTADEIRKFSAKRKKYEIHSFDDPIGNGDKTFEDKVPPVQFGQDKIQEEIRLLYGKLFIIYCKAFMTSTTFPPRCLALYYARVLPHLIEEIPNTKAASAKWAYERMGLRTVGELKVDSESTLQNYVDKDLQWCDDFVRQLSEEISEQGITDFLKNIIYTVLYDKDKIEDWSDYMHKMSTKSAMNMVLRDSNLLELAKEYISKKDALYKFVGKGICR